MVLEPGPGDQYEQPYDSLLFTNFVRFKNPRKLSNPFVQFLHLCKFVAGNEIMQSTEHYLSTDNYLLRSQKLIQNFMKFATKVLNIFCFIFRNKMC